MKGKLKRKVATVRLPRWGTWLKPTLVSGFVVAVAFFGLHWLSVLVERLEIDGAELGSVLEAQAAMTAIFLAAMIFIVEAVQRREGLDDPLYELFLSKSWARWIFATAVWLLIGTALLYVFGPFTLFFSELADARADVIGIASLVLAALLILAFLLRALDVLRPEEYRKLRRDAVLEQVHIGVRSQMQASQLSAEFVRQYRGVLNDPETQAARTIERVVDQTYQAVERTQLTEIREGITLLEDICKAILFELDERNGEDAEIPLLGGQGLLGQESVLAGMQRFVRVAANAVADDFILRAIFFTDVGRTETFYTTPYRLSDNVESANELFVRVMIECIENETDAMNKLPKTPLALSDKDPQAEMLKHALEAALSKSDAAGESARRHRIAMRVVQFIHEFAAGAAEREELYLAFELLEGCLQNADNAFPSAKEELINEDPLRSALRQAALSGIGYGVGRGHHRFLSKAERSTVVDELVRTGQTDHLHATLERDFTQQFTGESDLGGGPYWLTRGLRSFSGSGFDIQQATELEVRQADAECVVLGYMWLLGLVYKGIGEVVLPSEVQPEFNRVWHLYSGRLVSALRRAGIGEDRDLWGWCEAAFSVSRG